MSNPRIDLIGSCAARAARNGRVKIELSGAIKHRRELRLGRVVVRVVMEAIVVRGSGVH